MRYCLVCKATYLSRTQCPRDGSKLSLEHGDPLIGEVLGRYQVLERMAAGGMGQIYRAAHVRIASLAAIKVLYGDLAADAGMRARFEREAEAFSCLNSRYITRVIDFGETSTGILYLVMELLDGISLASAIARSGGLAPERAVRIFRRLALGLAHAHERGIVHRDLKPDNVMLVSEDEEPDVPKILDFGIARIRERPGVTEAGLLVGTPQYMAPEQFAGPGDVDLRSDLYALGVMLYKSLVGRPPFDAPTLRQIFELHALRPPRPLRQARPDVVIDAGLEAIVLKLLAKTPDERFATARALIEALDAWSNGKGAKSASPPKRARADPLARAGERIRKAIQRGAPLYNAGDQAGCADIYRKVAEALMTEDLHGDEHTALRARLASALRRANARDIGRAAWELRWAFDDVLFVAAELERRGSHENLVPPPPAYAADCPEHTAIIGDLDMAVLVAARRYASGHLDIVGDFYFALADLILARLSAKGTCGQVARRLEQALADADAAHSGAEKAVLLGAAFDELRFEGAKAAALPPAESMVIGACEGIEEIAEQIVKAIGAGAPAYNAGNAEGCARLYAQTIERILSQVKDNARNAPLRQLLARSLEVAKTDVSPESAAWTLRHAFDAVLEAWQVASHPQPISAVPRRP